MGINQDSLGYAAVTNIQRPLRVQTSLQGDTCREWVFWLVRTAGARPWRQKLSWCLWEMVRRPVLGVKWERRAVWEMGWWESCHAGSWWSWLPRVMENHRWVWSASVTRADILKVPAPVALLRIDYLNTLSFKPKAHTLHNPTVVGGASRALLKLVSLRSHL